MGVTKRSYDYVHVHVHFFDWSVESDLLWGALLFNQICHIAGAPVGMWTWGRVHTKFWHPP